MQILRMRMGCDDTLCDREVALDCEDCPYSYVCCCAFDVALTEEEAQRLDSVTLPDGTPALRRQQDGSCCYFDLNTKRCTVWDQRPDVCRRYSCLKDRRALSIQSVGLPLRQQPGFGGSVRVCLSVAVLDADSKHRTSPMMVHDSKSGVNSTCAVKTIEVVSSPTEAIQVVQGLVRAIIKNRLGGDDQSADS